MDQVGRGDGERRPGQLCGPSGCRGGVELDRRLRWAPGCETAAGEH